MRRLRRRLLALPVHLFLIASIVFFCLPFAWTVGTSFKPSSEYYVSDPGLLPQEPTLRHYQVTFFPDQTDSTGDGTYSVEEAGAIGKSIVTALRNSTVITGLTVIFTLLLALPMAYAFSRFEFRGRRGLAMWVLSTRMVPPIASVVPLYVVLRSVDLTDTQIGLAIPYTAANIPFAVWSLKGFLDEVPRELEEAAFVEGASRIAAFVRVILPLAAGGILATALLVLFLTWGEFLFAAVLTSREAQTLPVALSLFRQDRGILWGAMSATIVVSVIPIMTVAFLMQRQLVRGLSTGGIK